MKELPEFYNDIDKTLLEIKSMLSRGVKDRKSNFHYTTLCTIDNDSRPQARTVVFRSFNVEKFYLSIHSDFRSKKIKEIKKNKYVSLVFYDDKKKIQLRIRGIAKIEVSKKDSWHKLSNWSRRCYLSQETPGAIKQKPMPQLNVLIISSSEIFLLFNHLKTLVVFIFERSMFKVKCFGIDLSKFSIKPPPVI